ncbi:hypothetical protein ACU4GD_02380 [Cupriavidus basilensis]
MASACQNIAADSGNAAGIDFLQNGFYFGQLLLRHPDQRYHDGRTVQRARKSWRSIPPRHVDAPQGVTKPSSTSATWTPPATPRQRHHDGTQYRQRRDQRASVELVAGPATSSPSMLSRQAPDPACA